MDKKVKNDRPVDRAMEAVRDEKKTMRDLWMDTLEGYHRNFPDGLLYVTLPGAEGREFDLLTEKQIIVRTEIGGIAAESMGRIAAVENSPMAVANLQANFPGLKIYQTNFKSLIRGDGLLAYPNGEERDCCRARVINLDLNEILAHQFTEGSLTFPILNWIQKLGELHAAAPRVDWCLYLTLHGEVRWNTEASTLVRNFLRENFGRANTFAEHARIVLGDNLYNAIANGQAIEMSELTREEQQKMLMAFVPKKIADMVRTQHWRIETDYNIRYGQPHHAPMVSWIMHFRHDNRAAGTPDMVYVESVNRVLASAAQIDAQGVVALDIEE